MPSLRLSWSFHLSQHRLQHYSSRDPGHWYVGLFHKEHLGYLRPQAYVYQSMVTDALQRDSRLGAEPEQGRTIPTLALKVIGGAIWGS